MGTGHEQQLGTLGPKALLVFITHIFSLKQIELSPLIFYSPKDSEAEYIETCFS